MGNPVGLLFYIPVVLAGGWAFMRLFKLGRDIARGGRARGSTDPMFRFHHADTLARDRRNDEALAEYLWCFDHGLERHPEFGGVRLSFLLSSLARLGAVHPPARTAMEERRNRLQLAIDGHTATPEEGGEFAALNHFLGEDERTLDAYNRLSQDGKPAQQLRFLLFRNVFDRLLEARRYQDILKGCGPVEEHLDRSIEAFEFTKAMVDGRMSVPAPPGISAVVARRIFEANKPKLLEMGMNDVLETGGKFYETLLGASRVEEASRIADRLIDFSSTGRTYAALIRHALNAARPDLSVELARRGKQSLPSSQHAEIDAGSRPPRLP